MLLTQQPMTRQSYSVRRLVFAVLGSMAGSLLAFSLAAEEQSAPQLIKSHAFAMHGEPKYGPDFTHFDYVNPDAPKGGHMVMSAIGTYDNFHRYAQRGSAAINSTEFYDTLMIGSDDEIDVYYPLIAESLEYPEDYTFVIFNLNPDARHQDGEPITAADVAFSFNKFMTEGVPQFRSYYAGVTDTEEINPQRVKFSFSGPNKDYISGLARLVILPKHFWEERDFAEPLSVVPLGSGPYTVSDFSMGQNVTYKRLDDYWAADLPSRKGTLNFSTVRYDYYRDSTVALEAFKAGEYDFRQENSARQWVQDYTGPAFTRGDIKMEELPHQIPQGMQAFTFNIQRELFSDRRVRQALNFALDFEWMNKNLFYDQYERNTSYFQNTPYMASGKPEGLELEILEAYRDRLPEEVFGEVWTPNETDGSGNLRRETRQALALLKDAGWELRNQQLTHVESGQRFEFELLINSPTDERVALPLQRNMERLGIKMNIRLVDPTQFINRLRSRDFDMIARGYSALAYPSVSMRILFQSDFIDSTWNTAGIEDEVIDSLIEGIIAAQEDEEMLLAYGSAFDRVARWNFYVMPQWHSNLFRIAYWDRFSRPETRPVYELGLDTWWYDEEKASRITRR